MMKCYQMRLHIDTRTALIRRTDKHFLFTSPHFLEQCISLGICLCIMNKCNLLCRNAKLYQRILQIIVNCEVFVRSRSTNIRKNKLTTNTAISFRFFIFCIYVLCYLVKLSIRIVRCILIYQSCICSKKSRFMGNLKEIVLRWIYSTITDSFCPYHKVLHHLFHIPVWFGFHYYCFSSPKCWHIQIQHIRSLHICHFSENIHQFWQVRKLIESTLKSETAAFYCKLQCSGHFSKVGCPGIKMIDSHLFQCFFLKV